MGSEVRAHPGRSNVGQAQGRGKRPARTLPAVRHGVQLQVARIHLLPRLALDGDLMTEQSSRFGPAIQPLPHVPFLGAQITVDRPSADSQDLGLLKRGQGIAAADPRHPKLQDDLQTDRPRIIGLFPDLLDHGHNVFGVVAFPSPRDFRKCRLGIPHLVELDDGVLTVITRHGAQFVQDLSLHRLGSSAIAFPHRFLECFAHPYIHAPTSFPKKVRVNRAP
jgi:hypothetical protein